MERSFRVVNFAKTAFLSNKHSQTIFSSFFLPENKLKSEYLYEDIFLNTDDDLPDKLCIHHNPPLVSYKKSPVIFNGHYLVLVHGMEGTADSHYIVTLAETALRLGFGVIRMNLRACGFAEELASKPYNAGGSLDLGTVVSYIYNHISKNIILCGYSLSANMVLKYLGEAVRKEVKFFSAVSTPFDLKKGSEFIDSQQGKFYCDFFLRSFRDKLKRGLYSKATPEMRRLGMTAETMFDYDDFFTGPLNGFKGAIDYYKASSCINYIYNIPQQGIIVHADDDPLVPSALFESIDWRRLPNISPILTRGGGHVAFLAKRSHELPDGRWLNNTLLQYFAEKIGIYK
ncbi:MAG: alpha/beta fold hydrolase [Leptospiraceae bacterium]|nr:alpha/beta fold hydrolase [Leptospiraceae bacterium]